MRIVPIILLILALITLLGGTLLELIFGRKVQIRRLNPDKVERHGDLSFKDKSFLIKTLLQKRHFTLDQLQQVKVYTEVDWGLSEYDMAELNFPGVRILINLSTVENKAFVEDLIVMLNLRDLLPLQWGYLPKRNDTSKNDVIYSKKNS